MRLRGLLLGVILLVPAVRFVAAAPTPTPTATAADDPGSITYLGASYPLLPGCYGTVFVVGITQTTLGQTDQLLTAVPFPGGIQTLPPKNVAASGILATKQLGDAVCLQLTPTS